MSSGSETFSSLCNRQAGKVKKVLFCEDGHTVVIGGDFAQIFLWDSREPESSNVKVLRLRPGSCTLDMSWRRAGISYIELVVLSSTGEHVLFPVNHNCAEDQFEFSNPHESQAVKIHRSNEPFKHGKITCWESTIASTVGHEVAVREVSPLLDDAPLLVFSAASFNKNIPLHDRSRISHIHLLLSRRLLVFLLKEARIVEFDVVDRRCTREVCVTNRPVTAAVSDNLALIFAHDVDAGAQFYSLKDIQETNAGNIEVKTPGVPLPVAFIPRSPFAVLGDADKIHVSDTRSFMCTTFWTPARRMFALDGCLLQDGSTVRIAAAVMPEDEMKEGKHLKHGWTMRLFTYQAKARDIQKPETTSNIKTAGRVSREEPSAQPEKRKPDAADVTSVSKKQKRMVSSEEFSVQDRMRSRDRIRESCRFIGFRKLRREENGGCRLAFSGKCLPRAEREGFEFNKWKPPRTADHINIVKYETARALLPKLRAELRHIQHPGVQFRAFPKHTKWTCDKCYTSLLFQSWFCDGCGFELCSSCWEAFPVSNETPSTPCVGPHCKTWLTPTAVFSVEELNEHICAMESTLRSPPPKCLDPPPDTQRLIPESRRDKAPYSQEMCKYKVGNLSEQVFIKKWINKEPFVLVGITKSTSPAELLDLKQNGRKRCTTSFYDGETSHIKQSTLATYFKSWNGQSSSNRSLQIRDYPPKSDLQTVHPDLYNHFMRCMEHMFEAHMAPRRPLNLFSCFPRGSLLPDLGPKLYISEADLENNGTTLVHMDKAGAVNLMLFSKPGSDGQISGAHWDIWPSSSIFYLSKELDISASDESCRLGQPIISETHYISPSVSRNAFMKSGIRGWHTTQLPGEAVIIPPGCPHQVSNHSNCLKIAVDFISPSHISVLDMLRDAFRKMNIEEERIVHQDLLQHDVMLWYAWQSTLCIHPVQ